jgi:hypothetical protein
MSTSWSQLNKLRGWRHCGLHMLQTTLLSKSLNAQTFTMMHFALVMMVSLEQLMAFGLGGLPEFQ